MINVGRIIYGYCEGWFGRDDYDNKIIISEGENWIVCKKANDVYTKLVSFAQFDSEEEKLIYIKKWSIESQEC